MLSSLLALLAGPPFLIDYDGVPPEAERAFAEAAAIWSDCLVTGVPVRARVTWIDRGPTGFAYPRLVDGQDLPVQDAWYPAALANALRGERDADAADFHVFLQGGDDRYYGAASGIAEGQTDFVNVSLHEIAHGLGVATATFVPWDGEPVASLGLPNEFVSYFDFAFDLPEFDGTPFLYDTFLTLADGRTLADFENPSLALTKALANPTLHFAGPDATAANDSYPVAVTPLSVSHIPAMPRQPTPIMLSNSGRDESVRTLDPILLGMMADLGWEIAPAWFKAAKAARSPSRPAGSGAE